MGSVAGRNDVNTEPEVPHPSDVFGDLGNEVRTTVIETLFEASKTRDQPIPFSELFEASSADNTAGFAYHLRQLDGRFVEKSEAGYTLTYAGRKAAREVAAGSYTESHDVDPFPVEDACPICGGGGLVASGVDNHVSITCVDCEESILTLPFPPAGHRTDEQTELLTAFDRHHRHRLATMSDGNCPECAAAVDVTVEGVSDETDKDTAPNATDAPADGRVRLSLDCPECGCRLRCPVTLSVLDHPAVISFFHDHDRNVRDRPLWNVGSEWGEQLLATDPWCMLITARIDDEVLECYVSRDLSVIESRRREIE